MHYKHSESVANVYEKNYGHNAFLSLYLNLFNLWTPRTGGQTKFLSENKIIFLISACHPIFLGGYLQNLLLGPPSNRIDDSEKYQSYILFMDKL